MKYVFGPVPSRRLGLSLGIDLICDKVCSLDCVYCEIGITQTVTTERKEYTPLDDVKKELTIVLDKNPKIDYITFSGTGEPTLHSRIGELIRFLKINYPQYKIALLTNSTLLQNPAVIEDVLACDVILPSYDAGSDSVLKKLNRPALGITCNSILTGILALKKVYHGKIWLEIFIVPGLNDSPAELTALSEAAKLINPEEVHLNSLDRPGAENWVTTVDAVDWSPIASYFSPLPLKIVARQKNVSVSASKELGNLEEKFVSTLKIRPMTVEDLMLSFGLHLAEVNKILRSLESKYELKKQRENSEVFYSL